MIYHKLFQKIFLVILFFSLAFSISLSIAKAQDSDEDGIADVYDNCQYEYNPYQGDDDEDELGNICDNCPTDYNPWQKDSDKDGIGDICVGERCMIFLYNLPYWIDRDPIITDERTRTQTATYEAARHNFGSSITLLWNGRCYYNHTTDRYLSLCQSGNWDAYLPDMGEEYVGRWTVSCGNDADGDEYPDFGDNCPNIFNPGQEDYDRDGIGNVCEGITTTTTTTRAGICLAESIYGEFSKETEYLRHFRDAVLKRTPEGREIIKLYYEWNPMIVRAVERNEEFKQEIKDIVDEVLELIWVEN